MLKFLGFDAWLHLLLALRKDPSASMFTLANMTADPNGRTGVYYSQVHAVFKLLASEGFVSIVKVGRKNVLTLTPKGEATADAFLKLQEVSGCV